MPQSHCEICTFALAKKNVAQEILWSAANPYQTNGNLKFLTTGIGEELIPECASRESPRDHRENHWNSLHFQRPALMWNSARQRHPGGQSGNLMVIGNHHKPLAAVTFLHVPEMPGAGYWPKKTAARNLQHMLPQSGSLAMLSAVSYIIMQHYA